MPDYITIEVDPHRGVGPQFKHVKHQVLLHYLVRTQGRISQAADLMGMERATLHQLVFRHKLRPQIDRIRRDAARDAATAA